VSPRATVSDAYTDQQVLGIEFGVFYYHIEIASLVEDPGVNQLILRLDLGPPLVLLEQSTVGVFRLRVLVEILHV